MQQFGRRQPFVEAEIFGQKADFSADLHIAGGRAENKGLAAGGLAPDPSSILIDVLLPAPFGPRKPKISPRRTVSERSRTATLSPKTLRKCCV